MADVTILMTPGTEEVLSDLYPRSRINFIPNPVDIAALPPNDYTCKEPHRVLYLGWVLPSKGVLELIDSWINLKMAKWELIIAGPGEIKDLPSEGTVQYLGELSHDEAMKIMGGCDIFVLPSHSEGFPNVILEAMAYGKPIVATRVGAIPKMLAEGTTKPCGIIVEPYNSKQLSAALKRLMNNSKLRSNLGARARSRVIEKYDIGSVMDSIVGIWEDITPIHHDI